LLEAALGKLDEVNAQLAETQKELQQEVDLLQAELRRNQDPDRMSVIQEMISVSIYSPSHKALSK
jgi:vacuolar protein sorting-associated protein 53